MMPIMLSNDRTEVDMDRLAEAFGVNRTELEHRIRVGTTTYWFELGESDYDTPRMTFQSADTGNRVTLDRVGNVIARTGEEARNLRLHPSRPASRARVTEDMGFRRATHLAADLPRALTMTVSETARRARLDELLDEALRESFPASDPIAISFDAPSPGSKPSRRHHDC